MVGVAHIHYIPIQSFLSPFEAAWSTVVSSDDIVEIERARRRREREKPKLVFFALSRIGRRTQRGVTPSLASWSELKTKTTSSLRFLILEEAKRVHP